VGRIVFAVAGGVVLKTVVTLDVAVRELVSEVVSVSTVAIYNVAEHAVSGERQRKQLVAVKAAVLHEHEGNAGLLPGLDQRAAFLLAVGTANLHGYGYAVLHGHNGNLGVRLPAGGNVCHVGLEGFNHDGGIGIYLGTEAGLLLNLGGKLFGLVKIRVADADNANVLKIYNYALGYGCAAATGSADDEIDLFHFKILQIGQILHSLYHRFFAKYIGF
jgi:hypothetical protein